MSMFPQDDGKVADHLHPSSAISLHPVQIAGANQVPHLQGPFELPWARRPFAYISEHKFSQVHLRIPMVVLHSRFQRRLNHRDC